MGDAAYPLTPRILTPYKGVNYHRKDFGDRDFSEMNPSELFNRIHSSQRMVVERGIGLYKRKFGVFKRPMCFDLDFVNMICYCCAFLYNFSYHEEWDIEVDLNESDGELSGDDSE